ncbi:MAG: 5'-3'-deoxyribonucleotidase [Cytophagaceae bacterium]|nr:5'-3'-deoxyribonucleotidase [Cytophagaceae bacterium]
MQRIAIDMDDVLADATGRFLDYLTTRTGVEVTKQQLWGRDWADVTDIHRSTIRSWVYEAGFFRDMAVLPDAQDVVQKLQERYEVFIVSAAMEFPLSLKEKLEWMAEHFPFVDWRYIVFCGHKYMIKADYLIDDHEKNLKPFEGTPILFSAPHNANLTGYTRVSTWREVEQLLLPNAVEIVRT